MPDRFVLGDSNLLLHLTNTDSPSHELARRAVEVLNAQGSTLLYASQNLAEFWNVCTRVGPGGLSLSIEETVKRLRLIEERFGYLSELIPADDIYKKLLIQHEVRGVQVHDARLAALMIANDVREILTFDREDFKRFTELIVIHPEELS
jgi:predicted nucleic acid-binding protein